MNKKYILVVYFFIAFFWSFGQTYQFDKLVTSKLGNQKTKSLNLFSSKNSNYYMSLVVVDDSLQGRLFDRDTHVMHYYQLDKTNGFNFKYLRSVDKSESFNLRNTNNTIKLKPLKTKNGNERYKLFIYSGKGKLRAKYILTTEKSHKDYLYYYLLSVPVVDYWVTYSEITSEFPILVKHVKSQYSSNLYSLESIEDINLTVSVPDLSN